MDCFRIFLNYLVAIILMQLEEEQFITFLKKSFMKEHKILKVLK